MTANSDELDALIAPGDWVMSPAMADAAREALRSIERAELGRRRTDGPEISLEKMHALQMDSARLRVTERRLRLAVLLACLGWLLAAGLSLQPLVEALGRGS